MPYYLAPLWDVHYAHVDRSKPSVKTTKHQIPKDLRVKLKHARAAHGMLQDLEEEIRQFIQSRQEEEYEDSDEEIVFVGRNGQMHESGARRQRRSNERERKVLESAMDDRAAGFG